jgi:hypothetical protein
MIVNGEVGRELRKYVGVTAEVLVGNVQSRHWSIMLADLCKFIASCVIFECSQIDSRFYKMWEWPISSLNLCHIFQALCPSPGTN